MKININKRAYPFRLDATFSPVQVEQVCAALEGEAPEKGSIEEALQAELLGLFQDEIMRIKLKRQGKIKITLSLTQARMLAFMLKWFELDKAVRAALFEMK
ncbi:hypothetical protein [Hugenholtzia roseola]|uniref:hypothetical protein n=1 Tax=Hugenholtzia roseola TaxID=1002 RepID=UPI00047A0881|nr:hypothetical protein [Hugenholtzia roseola]